MRKRLVNRWYAFYIYIISSRGPQEANGASPTCQSRRLVLHCRKTHKNIRSRHMFPTQWCLAGSIGWHCGSRRRLVSAASVYCFWLKTTPSNMLQGVVNGCQLQANVFAPTRWRGHLRLNISTAGDEKVVSDENFFSRLLTLRQGWAINFARGPLWQGRVDGGLYLLAEVEASLGLQPQY